MFKVTIKQVERDVEEEIVVKCHEISDEVLRVVEHLKRGNEMILGARNDEIFRIPIKEIYYVESVDNKTYIYLQKNVYDSKLKLYEIEENYASTKLFRCSKSMIVNIAKIRSVTPSVNGRFEAKLQNGEIIIISRQYVQAFKKKIGM